MLFIIKSNSKSSKDAYQDWTEHVIYKYYDVERTLAQ